VTIEPRDVERIAELARLRLSDSERASMARQLGRILDYVKQLDELPTEDVEPLAHPLDLTDVMDEDEPGESLPREEALRNAPRQDGECYRVPAVL